jgi:hypothetical protein
LLIKCRVFIGFAFTLLNYFSNKKVKTTNELSQSGWINQQEQKFVSDQNLATITRKMALHADLATKCYRFQKDGNGMNPYGGKW